MTSEYYTYQVIDSQGNEQRDCAFGGSTGPLDDARNHAGVGPDHRWWRFFLIVGLDIVVGSYSNKQESFAAEL